MQGIQCLGFGKTTLPLRSHGHKGVNTLMNQAVTRSVKAASLVSQRGSVFCSEVSAKSFIGNAAQP